MTLDFTQCPNCGGEKSLANQVMQEEVAKGKIPKTTKAFLFQHQSIISNPTGQWLSAPMILSFYDVCVDCGTVYCIHAEVRTAVLGDKIPKSGNQFSTG